MIMEDIFKRYDKYLENEKKSKSSNIAKITNTPDIESLTLEEWSRIELKETYEKGNKLQSLNYGGFTFLLVSIIMLIFDPFYFLVIGLAQIGVFIYKKWSAYEKAALLQKIINT